MMKKYVYIGMLLIMGVPFLIVGNTAWAEICSSTSLCGYNSCSPGVCDSGPCSGCFPVPTISCGFSPSSVSPGGSATFSGSSSGVTNETGLFGVYSCSNGAYGSIPGGLPFSIKFSNIEEDLSCGAAVQSFHYDAAECEASVSVGGGGGGPPPPGCTPTGCTYTAPNGQVCNGTMCIEGGSCADDPTDNCPLPPPSSFTISSSSSCQGGVAKNKIEWTPSLHALSYDIYYCSSGSFCTPSILAGSVGGIQRAFVHAGVSEGVRYRYRVYAIGQFESTQSTNITSIITATCLVPPSCGNGIVESGEACDNGGANGSCPAACSTSCVVNVCGGPPPLCGNGIVESGEACDNGGANGSCPAACSTSCVVNICAGPVCGNGVVEAGEACDNGGANGVCPSSCSASCAINACGVPPDVTISGRVFNTVSNAGFGGATITTCTSPPTVSTDASGNFSFTVPPAGSFCVRVSPETRGGFNGPDLNNNAGLEWANTYEWQVAGKHCATEGGCTGNENIWDRALNSGYDFRYAPIAAPPINGQCGSSVNTCNAGTLVDTVDTMTEFKWECQGINGGATDFCSSPTSLQPPEGVAGPNHVIPLNSIHNHTGGAARDVNGDAINYTWSLTCNLVDGLAPCPSLFNTSGTLPAGSFSLTPVSTPQFTPLVRGFYRLRLDLVDTGSPPLSNVGVISTDDRAIGPGPTLSAAMLCPDETKLQLSWTTIGAPFYDVYKCTGASCPAFGWDSVSIWETVTALSTTDFTLTPGETYKYRVRGRWSLSWGSLESEFSNEVTVFASCVSPSADIKANGSDGPITIPFNTAAMLSWTSVNTTSCSVSPGGFTGVTGSSSTGNLISSQTYVLSCIGPVGPVSDSVVVNVGLPPDFTLSCTDPDTAVSGCSVIVEFSPALTSRSSKATIAITPINGLSSPVTFDITAIQELSPGSGIAPPLTFSQLIPGFTTIFNDTEMPSISVLTPYPDTLFSVKVGKQASDPDNDKVYQMTLRGQSGSIIRTIPITLTLKASGPGFEEK